MNENDETLWIKHAQGIANGDLPLSEKTLRKVAVINGYDSPFHREISEHRIRSLFRYLLVSFDTFGSENRAEVLETFKAAYDEEMNNERIN